MSTSVSSTHRMSTSNFNKTYMSRDVNGVGRVRVVVLPYPTRWINICPVPVPIFFGYPPIFFISAGIHGYPQVFTKLFKKQIFNHKFK